jgi:molybdopterin/thiamine biosynthesis adenylyltransferase
LEEDEMEALHDFLLTHVQGDLLPWQAQVEAGEHFGLTSGQVEETALKLNILPSRYQRNRQTISTAQQLTLFQSKVAVIGCGGLGGYIIEELARLGIGNIKAIDPDVFEEHNLNRQILCSIPVLGKSKAEVAEARVRDINPAVHLIPIKDAFSKANGVELLHDINVVVDALGNIPTRIELAETCETLGIPLIHGAIGGWYGQITTQLPGDQTIQKIYGQRSEVRGMEKVLGNPSFTPAIIASMEVAETCKLLLNQGTSLHKRILFINILDMEIEDIRI